MFVSPSADKSFILFSFSLKCFSISVSLGNYFPPKMADAVSGALYGSQFLPREVFKQILKVWET